MIHITKHIFRTLILIPVLLVEAVGFMAAQTVSAEVEIVINAGEYDFNIMPVASLGSMGAFGALGNKITALEDDGDGFNVRMFTLPDTINIEEFFFLPDKIVLKHRNNVLWVTLEGSFDGFCFADDEFHVAYASDTTLFVIRPDAYTISEFSMSKKDLMRIYRFTESPLSVGLIDSSMVAVTTNTLYFVSQDNESVILHHHPLPINCAAVTPLGTFFGTDDALWRLVGVDEIEHIASGSVNRIFGSGRILYLIDTSGNLYKLSFSEIVKE